MFNKTHPINERGNLPHTPPHIHGHVPPHLIGVEHKHNMITILYEEEKLYEKFGELWSYHVEAIAKEPPEIKILFALINGCKIHVNYEPYLAEPCRFENPGLSNDALLKLSEKLGVEKELLFSILDSAPTGVVSVILSIV